MSWVRPTSRSAAAARPVDPMHIPSPTPGALELTPRFGLDIPPQAESGVPRDAVEVISAAVDEARVRRRIVTLGPLTNLEDAFAADETLADRLAGVHAMLGTIDAPGERLRQRTRRQRIRSNGMPTPTRLRCPPCSPRTCRSRSCRWMRPRTCPSQRTSPTGSRRITGRRRGPRLRAPRSQPRPPPR